jgi:hypothetical protein
MASFHKGHICLSEVWKDTYYYYYYYYYYIHSLILLTYSQSVNIITKT